MRSNQSVFIYLLIFLVLSIILKLLGVINVSNIELLGYAFIFYGITLVFTSLRKNQPVVLFFGSSLFLTGLLFFLISNFEFNDSNEIIFPAILLILGIDFLMLFLNKPNKKILAVSLTSILSAAAVIFFLGSITFQNFYTSVINITAKYWPIVLITAGLLILLSIEYRKER